MPNKKTVLNLHSFIAIAISAIIFYYAEDLGKSFFLASLVFNIYLRLLFINFSALQIPGLEADTQDKRLNIMMSVFSGIRVALAGIVLAVLIIKFTLNLWACLAAFLLYQVILIVNGYAYNRRNFR